MVQEVLDPQQAVGVGDVGDGLDAHPDNLCTLPPQGIDDERRLLLHGDFVGDGGSPDSDLLLPDAVLQVGDLLVVLHGVAAQHGRLEGLVAYPRTPSSSLTTSLMTTSVPACKFML